MSEQQWVRLSVNAIGEVQARPVDPVLDQWAIAMAEREMGSAYLTIPSPAGTPRWWGLRGLRNHRDAGPLAMSMNPRHGDPRSVGIWVDVCGHEFPVSWNPDGWSHGWVTDGDEPVFAVFCPQAPGESWREIDPPQELMFGPTQ